MTFLAVARPRPGGGVSPVSEARLTRGSGRVSTTHGDLKTQGDRVSLASGRSAVPAFAWREGSWTLRAASAEKTRPDGSGST
jgi:hypothetical protein